MLYRLSLRTYLNLIALFCFVAVGLALLSQHYFNMMPCAWCVMQRLIYLVIGVVCLFSNLSLNLMYQKCLAILVFILSLCGMISAWYQYDVASHLYSCEMTFADRFMHATTGLDSAVPWLFGIYATCMDAAVKVLGVEYAIWSLIAFLLIAFFSLVGLAKRH